MKFDLLRSTHRTTTEFKEGHTIHSSRSETTFFASKLPDSFRLSIPGII